jgi:hypothetical protein
MFARTLDAKGAYKIDNDTEVIDLADGIFDPNKAMTQICSIYKVRKEYEMRPDLVSAALYGTTDYTEMILKYSLISNPFAIEKDDLIYGASMADIYNPVKDTAIDSTGVFDAVKNYHKYIDKSKVPEKPGSDKVTVNIPGPKKSDSEANISKTGNSGVTVRNGKIYFGALDEKLKSVDSPIVDCATDGTSLGDFLNAVLRNNNTQ